MRSVINLNNHCYIIDDSEPINEGDHYYLPKESKIAVCSKKLVLKNVIPEWTVKITHSTQEGVGKLIKLSEFKKYLDATGGATDTDKCVCPTETKQNKFLIKVGNNYHIITDDEIKLNDWVIFLDKKILYQVEHSSQLLDYNNDPDCKKITHSTQEIGAELKLSEVEELIYGYSVENLAKKYTNERNYLAEEEQGFKDGFKTHQKLTKDKLFTVDDMREMWQFVIDGAKEIMLNRTTQVTNFEDYISFMMPKTEWDIEIDENNKITLIK